MVWVSDPASLTPPRTGPTVKFMPLPRLPAGKRRCHGWLAITCAVAALSLAACSDDGAATDEAAPAAESSQTTAEVDADAGDAILIRTDLKATEESGGGQVLQGSLLGDEKFCPGGSFTDRMGRPEIGMVKTIECRDGTLVLGFDPDPSNLVQNSTWRVLEGTGRYAGMRGQGWMVVEFEAMSGSSGQQGHETFTGVVASDQ